MNKYLEFLNESKLQFLLEANISYAANFSELLDNIDDPISDELKSLKGKDVDVKTNHIALDYGKTDYILFVPEDKFEKMPWKILGPSTERSYTSIARAASSYYPIGDNIYIPSEGQTVEVVKNFTIEEQNELMKKIGTQLLHKHLFSHIKWKVGDQVRECFYRTDNLVKDLTGFKETPYKIGKFVNNFLTKAGIDFTNVDVERFVDKFKAEMAKKNDVFNNFKIVKGEDIRKYYYSGSYASLDGTLGSSCMRYSSCVDYFDIYVMNDDVSLIVFMDDVEEDKIRGRALLWEALQVSTGKTIQFMDRIYVNDSSDTELFKQFAINNKFFYKKKQDYSDTPLMYDNKDVSEVDSLIRVYVDAKDYDYYPYVDTVKYYNQNTGILSNQSIKYTIKLDSTTGGRCDICDTSGRVECYECDSDGNVGCYECDGSGKENCSNCDGSGNVECPDCDGNDPDCDFCKGHRTVECPRCDGDGNYDCPTCSGSGETLCDNCGGEGIRDCPECNGG
jgi:hypothetical protein